MEDDSNVLKAYGSNPMNQAMILSEASLGLNQYLKTPNQDVKVSFGTKSKKSGDKKSSLKISLLGS